MEFVLARYLMGYEIFGDWYKGGTSGAGSTTEYTERFRAWLPAFIREMRVQTVCDYGCGDWGWASMVDWKGIGVREYVGLEIVPELVDRLKGMYYAKPGVSFQVIDPVFPEVPPSDLVICKDVLQHLPNAEVDELMHRIDKTAIYCLWINDLSENGSNRDIPIGGYRPIDIRKDPFNCVEQCVFNFGHMPENKVAFLTRGALPVRR